ncbi:hypothetical protein [Streptomyces sp. SM12]|uniref:hypothetical protein n=1 Tax=Streptomyces sp. SM12 TaxID=1071602 RepID=UPI0011B07771|nr:hypothetical protein [Streptomyces sp. SM12]
MSSEETTESEAEVTVRTGAGPVGWGAASIPGRPPRRTSWRPDGPGSFQAPRGVRAVTDRTSRTWRRAGARWTADGMHHIRWRALVADHGPITDTTVNSATATT